MKLSTLFLIIGINLATAASGYSQSMLLTLKMNEKTLREVFNEIEQNSEYIFFYNDKAVNIHRKVSIDVVNQHIENILDQLFRETDNTYRIDDRQVYIARNQQAINQQAKKTITGKIIDAHGEAVIGANVMEKDTHNGTISDFDGQFTLQVPDEAFIRISYIGYLPREIPVKGRTNFSIVLQEDKQTLEDVVVVGYGTLKKIDLTGSVSTINQQMISNVQAATLDQKMIGQVAGVQIQQLSGAPGAGTSVKIRGSGSLGAGNEPLYVIDGMPYSSTMNQQTNPLLFINPDDIETITILKDASSTTIYGSRGANGVIMVTTKKGTAGKTQINYSMNVGFQQVPQKGRPQMLNQRQFAELQRDRIDLAVRKQENREPTPEDYPEEYRDLESLTGKGTDWYDMLLQTALKQEHTVSISHGSEDTRTFFSPGYMNQEGVIRHTGLERYSAKLNVDNQFGKVLINASLQPVYINQKIANTNSGRSDVIGIALWANPVLSPYDEKGNLIEYLTSPQNRYHTAWGFVNPLYMLENTIRTQQEVRNLGSSFVEWEIIDGLKVKTSINTIFAGSRSTRYTPGSVGGENNPPSGLGKSSNYQEHSFNWLWETTLNYQKRFKSHSINALVGYSRQRHTGKGMSIDAGPYPNDLIETINAAQEISSWDESVGKWSMISYIGRLNYSFRDKYLFTATFRSDGSSRFGVNNRFAFFPSFAGGWRISEENFLKENKYISNLKLRVSYGKSGNNNIGNYQHLPTIISGSYVFNNTEVSAPYVGLSNPYLGWEESGQIDLDIDLSLFQNRLALIVDLYNRKSNNMLINDVIPTITGFSSQIANKGSVRNRGLEIDLSGSPVRSTFVWEAGVSISFNRNKVLSTNANNDRILSGNVDGRSSHITEVGKPIGQFFRFVSDGIYTAEDLANPDVAKYPTAYEGAVKYLDLDGDGTITEILDYTAIGNPHPDFIFGIRNSFYYKNFDLSIIANGQYGGKVVNGLRMSTDNLQGFFNVGAEWANRWRSPENPGDGIHAGVVAQTPSLGHRLNSLWIEDATYLRIANITFGYTIPQQLVRKTKFISQVRASCSIQNVATFTGYSGANPESKQNGIDNTLAPGLDMTSYPLARTVTFSLQIGF
ncbi:MAG: TonB-dependent receptor [Tannerellaceae bacterium]|nr:TonB-dependent receptor [Tannerellaceae bacterium]